MNATPAPGPRELDVYFAALDRPAGAERMAFLDEACREEPALRKWVEEEIARQTTCEVSVEDEDKGDSNSQAVTAGAPTGHKPPSSLDVEAILAALRPEEPGEFIGPYKLVEQLGEGGFGIVWKAEQEKPVRRSVALKILKPGMDTRQVVVRFEQERQALAMMDHPGIAKVFDAGATSNGRPYFVMELVKGIPITEYCDKARLSVESRLEVFMRVCFAVQHAHQKGIIHRDLKPSNILVALNDDFLPVPKVIDLGLAKATEQGLTDGTRLFTMAEQMLGTPLYMSPEQADSGQMVDTRTDIYSLGVVLYELLTGRTPFDEDKLRRRGHDEIRRAIREREPARPSSFLRSFSPEELRETAEQRRLDPRRLVRKVRHDLDWICMKSLEKDPRRRYAAASALAADIQHFLLSEPILARPPSHWYRAGKLMRRRWGAVLGGAALAASVVAAAFFGFRDAAQARSAARQALAAQALETELRATAESERASARISEYVANTELAQMALASGNLGRARQLLDKERPHAGEADLRGFAWRYLWQQCQGDPREALPSHGEPAAALAFSPSGDVLAVGGLSAVTLCRLSTRERLARLPVAADSLAFLPDGRTLVTAAAGTIHLWNTETWTETASWSEGIGPFALSPDGRRIAIICPEGICIRDTATWTQERFLEKAASPAAFSPDGQTLACDSPGGIALWPMADGLKQVVLPDSVGALTGGAIAFFHPMRTLAFTPDGATLIVAQNGLSEHGVFTVGLWDVRLEKETAGKEIAAMPEDPERPEHTGVISSLAVSPNGQLLATASLDHSVRLWDLRRQKRVAIRQGHLAEVGAVAFAPDGATVVTCDRLGAVFMWDLRAKTESEEAIGEALEPLGFSTDGRRLAAITRENAVVFYDAATRQALGRSALQEEHASPERVAVDGDFSLLAEGLDDGRVRIVNLATGEERLVKVGNGPVTLAAVSRDGGSLVSECGGENLQALDLRSGKRVDLRRWASRAVFSPDGKTLAVAPAPAEIGEMPALAPENARVVVLDAATFVVRATLGAESRGTLAVAFSPDGRMAATGGMDETVRIWDARTGALLGACVGHKQMVEAVAFSYDGKTVASSGEDGELRFWNVASGQELLAVQDLAGSMTRLVFSPDDRELAVARASARTRGLRIYRARLLPEIDQ